MLYKVTTKKTTELSASILSPLTLKETVELKGTLR
jgi:hypothetical protein